MSAQGRLLIDHVAMQASQGLQHPVIQIRFPRSGELFYQHRQGGLQIMDGVDQPVFVKGRYFVKATHWRSSFWRCIANAVIPRCGENGGVKALNW
jgi:hypothetical protein